MTTFLTNSKVKLAWNRTWKYIFWCFLLVLRKIVWTFILILVKNLSIFYLFLIWLIIARSWWLLSSLKIWKFRRTRYKNFRLLISIGLLFDWKLKTWIIRTWTWWFLFHFYVQILIKIFSFMVQSALTSCLTLIVFAVVFIFIWKKHSH